MNSAKNFIRNHKRLLSIARACKHALHPVKHDWHVVTFEDIFGLAVDWADMLPKDFDCIIGVPRSGLLIANVLAAKMGKPLSTADDFVRGIVWVSKDSEKGSAYKRVLIVEDAVDTARALKEDIAKLKAYNPLLEVKTGCLFTQNPEMQRWIDYYYASAHDAPAEWHMHSFFKSTVLAVDLDGVLLEEKTGNPLLIPAFHVEAVITARLENQRAAVEEWLKRHGVKCNKLIMFQGKAEERSLMNLAKYKAESIRLVGAEWFWESEPEMAEAICGIIKLPIYCPTNRRIYSSKSRWVQSFTHKKK
jgi:hypoxanthine phosphoribosyltransferase